jgi:hypothetical protein
LNGGAGMATIEINNLFSRIIDATPKGIRAVDMALSVESPGHEFTSAFRMGNWDGNIHFFSVANKKFPTGLLSLVYKALISVGEKVELDDKRDIIEVDIPDEIKLKDGKKSIVLRDYQYEAVKDALTLTRGIINIATNGGKCVTGDTKLLTSQGYKTIYQIFKENGTPCEDIEKSVSTNVELINRYGNVEKASHLTFNGKKPVRKITTGTGIEHKCTSSCEGLEQDWNILLSVEGSQEY